MKKVGILGGGQLGRMLLQQAANYPVETYVLENDAACPSAHLCHHFHLGDIRNYDAVLNFGSLVDVITIEIESVNIEALEMLERNGKIVIPNTHVLKTIKNKILQKEFYLKHEIPSPDFVVTHSIEVLQEHAHMLPAVHKMGEGGYDGKGVQMMHSEQDFQKGFDAPAVLEKKIEIDKEIAVIVAVDQHKKMVMYPPVEMVFDPYLNLLDFQLCPAQIDKQVLWKIEAICMKLVKAFASPGLFAAALPKG